MSNQSKIILNSQQLDLTINRLCFEIIENTKNFLYDLLPCNNSLGDPLENNLVNIYPNPTTNNLFIELNDKIIPIIIKIFCMFI